MRKIIRNSYKYPQKRDYFRLFIIICFLIFSSICVKAQTNEDAIMMVKHNFCVGGMYSQSSWKNYWEGDFKRNNLNIGTVFSQMAGFMGTYGVTDNFNVIVNIPYIWTSATVGTLHQMHGLQDLSAWIKWMLVEKDWGKGTISVYTLGGFSVPLSNYEPNYLPLAIGMHSKTLSGRLMADYQINHFFITVSGTYTWRSNITIDQNSYYTTQEILSNEVDMPNMSAFNFSTGFRSGFLIAEALVSNITTIGGFDIRKNDMPFPSNKMNAINVGINVKWTLKKSPNLSLIGGGNYVLAGRNVGQSTTINGGAFYVVDFSHSKKTSNPAAKIK